MVRPEGEVADLLEKFVPVRMVQANAMDMSIFQFDYDMSFAVFFLAADKTIYGRYGTRTESAGGDAASQISLKGLARSMEAALALHSNRDRYEAGLAAKTGPAPKFPTPEQHPQLRKYSPKIAYGPNVAKSCIHCHQVRDVERLGLRADDKPIPDSMLYPYPMPEVLGLQFDPDTRARVAGVVPASMAAKKGLVPGDQLQSLAGQPVVSVADMQWVLEQTPAKGGRISAQFLRAGGKRLTVGFELEPGWRRRGDISWRVSTWDLRRMALGGMYLRPLEDAERRRLGLEGKLGLYAKHVGQYNDHAVAKRAGVIKGDVLIEFDGLRDDLSESAVIAHAMQNRRAGNVIPIVMLRDGREMKFRIRLQ